MGKSNLNNVYFFGTSEIAVPVLSRLEQCGIHVTTVISQPPTTNSKGEKIFSPVSVWARQHKLNAIEPMHLNDETFLAAFKKVPPDLCVLMAYGNIIPKTLLTIPTYGWINIHPSLLPRWRGASPIQHTILNGDTTTGSTILLMDDGIDTGDILCQQSIDTPSHITHTELSKKLGDLSADMICDCIKKYTHDELTPKKQPQQSPTPLTIRLTKQDGKIDWSQPATAIERHIRALQPWPGSWSLLDGQTLKIIQGSATACEDTLAIGTCHLSNNTLHIKTGDGCLTVLQLQRAGKKAMTTEEFLRGFSNITGKQLN